MNGKKIEEEWNPDLAWDGTGFIKTKFDIYLDSKDNSLVFRIHNENEGAANDDK